MELNDTNGNQYQVVAELKAGGQAMAFRAKDVSSGAEVVIKLFHKPPQGSAVTAAVKRLSTIIEHGESIVPNIPEVLICFPTQIINDGQRFGVVMPVAVGSELADNEFLLPPNDQMEEYSGKAIYGIKQGVLPYGNMILAAFYLARSIDLIHRKGMAHSDLSLMNVFFDPNNGRISIIDCDNIACDGYLDMQVKGTPGFMAPELLSNGQSAVNTDTDRFSLSLLIYYLLMLRHPFVGNQGDDWSPTYKDVEDAYGSRAIFTEHPTIDANRFNGDFPHIKFNSLPERLGKMFTDAFVDGLNNKAARPTARKWAQTLWQSYECTAQCTFCNQRYFVNVGNPTCPFCDNTNSGPHYVLEGERGRMILAENGRKMYPHHSFTGREFDFTEALCEFQMRSNTRGSDQMILRNLNHPNLKLFAKGKSRPCPPGKGFVLNGVDQITVGEITYELSQL